MFKQTCINLVLAIVFAAISFAQPHSGYHVTKAIAVGGEGGWDYITFDAQSHRLFASHGNRVMVASTDSDKVVGEILKTEGVHGIAVANEYNRGFISNGRASTVSIFDLKTLQVLDTASVGKNPDAILYDAFSQRVFVFNGRSEDVSVLDAKTDKVIETLPVGGKLEFAATDGKGRIFVNVEDKGEIVSIDAKEIKILSRWSLNPGEEPSGLAIDVEHHRLFSVCGNKVMVVSDYENGKVVATVPIGDRSDGCAFDPGTGLAFSSNGDGTMTVVQKDVAGTYSVLETVKTRIGARTITLDPVTHTLYLPTAEFGPTPTPTAERPHPRPVILPNTFVILKVQK
jgi:YVTN family beta-propeller protein